MNEQGPRPLLDAEEFSWLLRLVIVIVGVPAVALLGGIAAGLAVAGFRMVT